MQTVTTKPPSRPSVGSSASSAANPQLQQRPVKKERRVLKFIITGIVFFVAALLVIGGIKVLQIFTMIKSGQPPMPPTTVTSAPVQEETLGAGIIRRRLGRSGAGRDARDGVAGHGRAR